jgi:hypothetical protein
MLANMNVTLRKSLIALVPTCLLFVWAITSYVRCKTIWTFLRVFGAGCLLMVVFLHLCEAEHWFAFMQWGRPHSVGHYLDFVCAILGLTVFPLGIISTPVTTRGRRTA